MNSSIAQRVAAAMTEAEFIAKIKAGTVANILPTTEVVISRTVKNETPNNEWRPLSPDTSTLLPPTYYRPYLATAETVQFKSDNAADGPGGIGALTIDAFFPDFSGTWKYEEITMNGTNGVDTVGTHNGLIHMEATSWGTLRRNKDAIKGYGKTTTDNKFGRIGTEHNISELPFIWVPQGWRLDITPTNYRSEALNARFTVNTYDVSKDAEFLIEDVDPVGPTNPAVGEFMTVFGGNFVWFAALNISGSTATQSAGITAFLRKE